MQELCCNVVAVVKPLHSLGIIKMFPRHEPLLLVHFSVRRTHIVYNGDLRRHFALGRPALLQKCLDLRLVLCHVVVVNMFEAISVENGRVVEVVRE